MARNARRPRTDAHVALIRGINVGTAKRVAMADLRAAIEGLGYENVRTLLNSGNVVFSTGSRARVDHARRIEQAMARKTGVSARVVTLTGAELGTIVRENALGPEADNGSRVLIVIPLAADAVARLAPLLAETWTPEKLAIGGRAAYLWCPNSILESALLDRVSRVLADGFTYRNWNTISKLHDMVRTMGEP